MTIRPVINEEDFKKICAIESVVASNTDFR